MGLEQTMQVLKDLMSVLNGATSGNMLVASMSTGSGGSIAGKWSSAVEIVRSVRKQASLVDQ